LPLLAARLIGAGGIDDEGDDDMPAELAVG
jgi:hypothetical protein